MAYYSEDAIEEVISNTDIVDLIGQYVPLKRRGANYIGLCPFHREKTPSFTVAPDKQIFKCFGCSEGGTAIQFVMKIENLDFREALEFLADKYSIDLSRFEVGSKISNPETKDMKERIFALNKVAAKYFYDALFENVKEENSNLREYLKKRELTQNVVTRFGLGFGNKKDEGLYSFLLKEGFTKEEILKSGIVTLNTKGNIYENFAGRLIFPIFDTRDRVIGFGGRVLDNSLPKYVNSPENIVYHKGKNLYGMNVAKKEQLTSVIIVEGYMDTVALHKSGINNVVASLGTALTEGQAKLIKKYTDTVIISYDQDNAGKAATLRAIDILYNVGLKVKVLILDHQDVKDPDEYINKYGKTKFEECVRNSVNHIDYKVRVLEENLDINNMDSKIEFLNKVANILAGIANNIERDMYIDDIVKKYKISKGALSAEIMKKVKSPSEETIVSNVDMTYLVNKRESSLSKRRKQEMYIIFTLLSRERKYINSIKEIVSEKDFESDDLRELFNDIVSLDNTEDIAKVNILKHLTDGDKIKLITEILCVNILDKAKFIEDLKIDLKKYRYDKRREEILKRMSDKDVSKDEREMLSIELSQIIINRGKLR